jgi:hypothetical protein
MGGMEIMLKNMLGAMGFDPDELRAKFTSAASEVKSTIQHFEARLDAIEARQEQILVLLQQLNGGNNERSIDIGSNGTACGSSTSGGTIATGFNSGSGITPEA